VVAEDDMRLLSETFADMTTMPDDCAFGLVEPGGSVRFARNLNPQLSWHDLPRGTRSLVLINDDLDVPVDVGNFNKADAVISRGQARRSLCHWVLVDLAPDGKPIGLGEFSNGVTMGGKPPIEVRPGAREGVNEYTEWFRGDAVMAGNYLGYDGPCPPFNDDRPHRYVFTLYALDVRRLQLDGVFDKSLAERAMNNHILDSASLTGLFSCNPDLRTERAE
jgi:Raf kinase inhibitor-like YbhB/YbcL family protein